MGQENCQTSPTSSKGDTGMSDLSNLLRGNTFEVLNHADEAADELERMDAVIARLGDKKRIWQPVPCHLIYTAVRELAARIQYALDNQSKPEITEQDIAETNTPEGER